MFDDGYVSQVRLLLRCIPEIEKHECFALKGGSAINLFLRDMPRLSVDIDLTFLPLSPRNEALEKISESLRSLGQEISSRIPNVSVQQQCRDDKVVKLIVSDRSAVIKVEPNPVMRGSVYPTSKRVVLPSVEDTFGMFVSMNTLDTEELYAGKLCAALDRQHPRDFFDIKLLLEDEGKISARLSSAFAIYLASHRRPMHELLNPGFNDISDSYEKNFRGMSRVGVSLAELQEVQHKLPGLVVKSLSDNDKKFLVSVKTAEPDWGLLPLSHIQGLPALKWKLINIRKMPGDKHRQSLAALRKVLGM